LIHSCTHRSGSPSRPYEPWHPLPVHFKPLLTAYYPLLDIRVYDLRHTHVAHLLAAGNAPHVVAKRVGHASAKMPLDVYGHVLPRQDGEAVAKLEA
jgi:integrase